MSTKEYICHNCQATFDLEEQQHDYDVAYCPYCGEKNVVTLW